MKTLMTALALGTLAAGFIVQSANAQQSPDDLGPRARAIHDCMEMNRTHNTDPYSPTGGVQHMYQACMTNKGQRP
jgi:hypothetical protein